MELATPGRGQWNGVDVHGVLMLVARYPFKPNKYNGEEYDNDDKDSANDANKDDIAFGGLVGGETGPYGWCTGHDTMVVVDDRKRV